jgi:hypothetical protein
VRALAASDANLVRDLGGANTVAGSADAITVALADASTPAYFDGMRFSFRVGTDNATTTPTLNVDGLGAKTIKKSIAGVESALVVGDLQAGMTAEVVYRSAWASAAGAFELLNPHTINTTSAIITTVNPTTIELEHASDTTLTRLSAGVPGVEGNQLQRVLYVAAVATTSGSTIDFTGIPDWVKEIDIVFNEVSHNSGSADYLIQIGDSGGVETTAYQSAGNSGYDGSNFSGAYTTSGFLMRSQNAAHLFSGVMRLRLHSGTTWISDHTGKTDSATQFGGGSKTLSAVLDRVRLALTTGSYDSGAVNLICRG